MLGIHTAELRFEVVRPTLHDLGLWSECAENLLLGTAAVESHMGHKLHQEQGPALGIYQIECATHDDLWQNYLNWHQDLANRIMGFASQRSAKAGLERDLVVNLAYATAIARAIYSRVGEELPPADDPEALGAYWKKHYNTEKGRGSVEHFVECFWQHEVIVQI